MSKSRLYILIVLLVAAGGCAGDIPYRTQGFSEMPICREVYDRNAGNGAIIDERDESLNRCWKRSYEERSDYELLFAEFDDQGWIQGTAGQKDAAPDHLDSLFQKLTGLQA